MKARPPTDPPQGRSMGGEKRARFARGAFYATARRYEVIGHLFDGVHDWEKHIAKITAFWSSVALLTGRYHGQPLAAHFPLRLEPLHFARWLVLFEQTARQVCTPEGSDYLMEKAHRIARSLEMGVAVSRGELPSRIGASHEQ